MKKKKKILSVLAVCTFIVCAAAAGQIPVMEKDIQVSAESIAFSCKLPPSGYDQQRANTAKGKVTEITYQSKATNSNRTALVYTPPGYRESGESYPVLYLQHGAGENENCWVFNGKVNFICTALTATAVTGWLTGAAEQTLCLTI